MFQFSLSKRKPCFRKLNTLFAVASLSLIVTAQLVSAANVINAVRADSQGSTHTISIVASSEPAYTAYELFKPSRIVVDIADASITNAEILNLPETLPFSLATSTVSDSDPALTRFEFTFASEYAGYDVHTSNNEIVLAVNMGNGSSGAPQPASINNLIAEKQNIESQLPQVNISSGADTAFAASSEPQTPGETLQRSFSFGGYNKQRISVDFYKIDLHNVFRLFREISDINIVVDEAVSGSLTLALNDVPWDFALDIILNLKGLQKEERFNTIVILPGNKQFVWPERAEDNLSFEADETVAVQEAIVIQQQMNIPPEVVEAKKLVQQGRSFEKNGSYEDAIKAYSEAFTKWPENDRLANKIASIYLVYLRQNAKAVHFAKQALQANSQNSAAALNAAIALANMQEYAEAQQYFDQSVSADTPSREALLSYAVFGEDQKQYDGALKLLDKYETLYGQNVDSMVAYARILDKQGNHAAATEKYKKVLLSGYPIPPDLKNYIKSRIALNQSM